MKIIFHSFSMGDVDDVDIYAAQPIYDWQQSEQGRWVMSHVKDVRYYSSPDMHTFGHRISIMGTLDSGPLLTEYLLRWGGKE